MLLSKIFELKKTGSLELSVFLVLLAAQDLLDGLEGFEFEGAWIVAEGPHLAGDVTVEILFET